MPGLNVICASVLLAIPTTVLVVGACTLAYAASLECVEIPCRQANGTCIIDGCAIPYPGDANSTVTVGLGRPCSFGCAGRKAYARSGSIVLVCVGGDVLLVFAAVIAIVSWSCQAPRVRPSRATDVEKAPERAECTICLEPVKKAAIRTPCNHWFHGACLRRWLAVKPTCPNCTAKIEDGAP